MNLSVLHESMIVPAPTVSPKHRCFCLENCAIALFNHRGCFLGTRGSRSSFQTNFRGFKLHLHFDTDHCRYGVAPARLGRTGRADNVRLEHAHAQIISLVAETGGVLAKEAYQQLCAEGLFRDVEPSTFAALLRELAGHDVLEQTPKGELILGLVDEGLSCCLAHLVQNMINLWERHYCPNPIADDGSI